MLLDGKSALVTGATSGIGEATARAFAREGARVMLTGRDQQRGEALKAALGEGADFIQTELGTAHSANGLIHEATARLGGLDILVNSAGVIYHHSVPNTTDAIWQETMSINVDAVFYLSRAAVIGMIERGGGVIVNVASTWGLVGAAQSAAYCASKGAVVQLTRAMAVDHAASNVRINVVCPGAVDTPMLAREAQAFGVDLEEGRNTWAMDAPDQKLASAEDIADAVTFLASERAKHIHGAVLPVDGGAIAF